MDCGVSISEITKLINENRNRRFPCHLLMKKVLVIADDRLVENSLDSDQFFMVLLPERKSQGIRVSVSETLNSSSNESY
ncbi:hypothetical protein OIU85_013593 [Salix viminalis]|uniref:Uncharacterized protein n=1 Tax=Salix viminalis TaxID=40686 RepID=A0A9Q0SCY1_SALVM|nr:hypothetical protein OIU85_013593 [Salix viminalis]